MFVLLAIIAAVHVILFGTYTKSFASPTKVNVPPTLLNVALTVKLATELGAAVCFPRKVASTTYAVPDTVAVVNEVITVGVASDVVTVPVWTNKSAGFIPVATNAELVELVAIKLLAAAKLPAPVPPFKIGNTPEIEVAVFKGRGPYVAAVPTVPVLSNAWFAGGAVIGAVPPLVVANTPVIDDALFKGKAPYTAAVPTVPELNNGWLAVVEEFTAIPVGLDMIEADPTALSVLPVKFKPLPAIKLTSAGVNARHAILVA